MHGATEYECENYNYRLIHANMKNLSLPLQHTVTCYVNKYKSISDLMVILRREYILSKKSLVASCRGTTAWRARRADDGKKRSRAEQNGFRPTT